LQFWTSRDLGFGALGFEALGFEALEFGALRVELLQELRAGRIDRSDWVSMCPIMNEVHLMGPMKEILDLGKP
jgi:hypothetical protein